MKVAVILIVFLFSSLGLRSQSFDIEDYSRFYEDHRGFWYVDNNSIEYHGQKINFWTALNNSQEMVLMFMSTELDCKAKQLRVWQTVAKTFSTGKVVTVGRKTGWLRRDGIAQHLGEELCKK